MQSADTHPNADPSLSTSETALAVVAVAVALGISAFVEIYDTRSASARVSLTVAALASSYFVAWLVLIALRIAPSRRIRGAIFAVLPSALLLSQTPYIGYLLVPFEILVAAWLVRSKAGLLFWQALLGAGAARGAALLAVWALRSLFGQLMG